MKNVTIYSTPTCSFCKMAKQYFTENNVAYTEIDVAADEVAREKMFTISKQMGVPVIDIDGEVTVGFNKPKLAQLLGLSA